MTDRRWSYLPALDGVRALAVVAVVLFHFWPSVFPGGFVGVDVFFVMSGFLITGILLDERDRTGGVDLRAFWGRRVRRLVPAVVVLVIVTAVATAAVGTGSWRQLADSIGALTWTTNIVEAVLGGTRIWMHNSRTVLDHLWSLAIEEQFYLVWPMVAMVLLRRVPARAARIAVVAVMIAASAAAMGWVGGIHAYFRTDTRAFELLAGALLALAGWSSTRVSMAASSGLAVAGLGGLIAYVLVVEPGGSWMYPWGFLVLTCATTAVVAAAVHPPRWLAAALEQRLVRHVGQVSYGIYLWHIPVLRILSAKRLGFDGPALHLVRFVVLAAIVEASYRFVEQPFRTRRIPFGWRQFALAYGAAALSLLLLVPAARRDAAGQWDPIDGPPKVAAGQTKVMIVGDLYGAALAANLSPRAGVWSLADPGCPAIVGSGLGDGVQLNDGGRPFRLADAAYCRHWPKRWARSVERFEPDLVVVANGFWDTLPVARDGHAVVGADLDRLYTDLVAKQVTVLRSAGVPADRIQFIPLDKWATIVDPSQVDLIDGRADAVASYDRAIEAAVERFGVMVVRPLSGPDDAIRR